jgi:uncharacterized membrane protein YhhN
MWTAGIAAAGVVGAGHIAARYAGSRPVAAALKAIPIALLAAFVAMEPAVVSERYRWLVFAALLWSLGGDLWLVFPGGFVPGLLNFLVAHVLYIAAFASGGSAGGTAVLVLLLFLAGGLAMLAYLWPHLGKDRILVLVYVGAIVAMGWRAAARALAPGVPEPSGTLALTGAIVFMVSDGVLAIDRFARPFAAADGVVMITYYAAQILMAVSVRA